MFISWGTVDEPQKTFNHNRSVNDAQMSWEIDFLAKTKSRPKQQIGFAGSQSK